MGICLKKMAFLLKQGSVDRFNLKMSSFNIGNPNEDIRWLSVVILCNLHNRISYTGRTIYLYTEMMHWYPVWWSCWNSSFTSQRLVLSHWWFLCCIAKQWLHQTLLCWSRSSGGNFVIDSWMIFCPVTPFTWISPALTWKPEPGLVWRICSWLIPCANWCCWSHVPVD